MSVALQAVAESTVVSGSPSRHHLFAAVLLGRPFDEPDLAIRACTRFALAEATRAVGTGRVGVERAELLAFRLIYNALRAEAATVGPGVVPPKGGAQWRRTLHALTCVRHRQRAVLALRYMFGLSAKDAGWVVGARDGTPIVSAGTARVVRAMGGPASVGRSLQLAGRKLIVPAPEPVPPVVPMLLRMPRRVTRTLLAPPLEDAEPIPPQPGRSPVEVLISAHPRPEPCVPGAPSRPGWWPVASRVIVAAGVLALFVWAVWPHQ